MMLRTLLLSSALVALVLFFNPAAWATDLSDEYLLGTWVVESPDCTSRASEFVVFRDSGAVESVRAGKLEAAGFWMAEGDLVKMHLIASPAYFHDVKAHFSKLAGAGGGFSSFEIRVIPLNIEQDKFDAVGVLEDQVAVTTFRRCESTPPS